MNWRSGGAYLAAAVACMALLLVFIAVIAVKEQRKEVAVQLPVGKPQELAGFPDDFGRLDELVPFAGGTSPVPVDVVPMEHAPEFQDSEWVNAQDPSAFTLQVLAAREEGVIKRFLAGREDRADFSYFVFPQGEGSWFVLTTGRYATHELAASIGESKEFGDLTARPFPRRMSVYQEALRLSPEADGAAVAPTP